MAKLSDEIFVRTCPMCGGLHYGSHGCPYQQTICDVCHKTLLQHEGRMFCEGGKTLHNPTSNFTREELQAIAAKANMLSATPDLKLREALNQLGNWAIITASRGDEI